MIVSGLVLPARTIGRVGRSAGLPAWAADALGALRYGHAAKLFVPLDGPAAPSAVMSVPERYWCWTATGERDRVQPVLSAFASSPGALARLAVERGPQRRLAFAGEHLGGEFAALMEGAIRSGRNAARALLGVRAPS